jgi:prophage regulatory protein
MPQELTPQVLLRLPKVIHRTGLGRSTIYRMVARKQFPSPIRISTRAVAWRQTDIADWIEGRTPTSSSPDIGNRESTTALFHQLGRALAPSSRSTQS